MKRITDKTILKQGDTIYRPTRLYTELCWMDKNNILVAQAEPIRNGLPVISLDNYNTMRIMDGEYPVDFDSYSQKDLEKAIELARVNQIGYNEGYAVVYHEHTIEDIFKEIDTIPVVYIDEDFDITHVDF